MVLTSRQRDTVLIQTILMLDPMPALTSDIDLASLDLWLPDGIDG